MATWIRPLLMPPGSWLGLRMGPIPSVRFRQLCLDDSEGICIERRVPSIQFYQSDTRDHAEELRIVLPAALDHALPILEPAASEYLNAELGETLKESWKVVSSRCYSFETRVPLERFASRISDRIRYNPFLDLDDFWHWFRETRLDLQLLVAAQPELRICWSLLSEWERWIAPGGPSVLDQLTGSGESSNG